MTTARLQVLADELHEARERRIPIAPLTERFPDLDADDAYRIQRLNTERLRSHGRVVRGHKVGLTSSAMQQMLGVDQPDFGVIFDDMVLAAGDEVDTAQFCAPRVEPEVAFVLGRPLEGRSCSLANVLNATDYVVPALEIIDSRIADWKIKLVDTIADNASSGACVLGDLRTDPHDVDWLSTAVELRRDGALVETGVTGAVLDHPANAVAWLVSTLHRFGEGLQAGDIVMPGSCTQAIDATPGVVVEASFGRLGSVTVTFA